MNWPSANQRSPVPRAASTTLAVPPSVTPHNHPSRTVMTTRYDVTRVPLQGAYVARQCPVRAQNDAIGPGEPLPPDAALQRRFDHGNAFESEILTELVAGEPGAVVVAGGGQSAAAATLAAMHGGAPLIQNGRLTDDAGRRVGKPDLLVRAPGGAYRAVDVKWHMALDVAGPSGPGTPVLLSGLSSVSRESAHQDGSCVARRHEGDLLQLAHYQRLLEALGFAAADGRFAAIIGTERQVVWHDLDARIWRTPSLSQGSKLRTMMERYDFEFGFRLDIIAAAQQHLADPRIDLLVVPVRCGQCPTCPWSGYCMPILETPPGDVSLLPRVGWRQWQAHRERGVTDRAQLAGLDWRTASLIAASVDVRSLMRSVADMDAEVDVAACDGIAETTITALHAFRVVTVADVRLLDAMTARYSDAGMTTLPEQIDQARAAIGAGPVYRRRGIAELTVPRADVEVDIDMENVEEGVYLWGNLVTDRSTGRGQPAYVPFSTWEPLTNDVETLNSLTFWRWLMDLRSATRSRGLTFAAFCYNAGAENRQLRRLGLGAGIQSEIDAFIASDHWVDMLRVFDSQLITGGSIGLKTTAPLAGFSWSVDDADGAESMVMHDIAVAGATESERQDARRWLLTYNEGDVRATFALREWMARDGAAIPSIR